MGAEGSEYCAHVVESGRKMHLEGTGLVCGGGEFLVGGVDSDDIHARKRDVAGLHRAVKDAGGSRWARWYRNCRCLRRILTAELLLPPAYSCKRGGPGGDSEAAGETGHRVIRAISLRDANSRRKTRLAAIIRMEMPVSTRLIYTACLCQQMGPTRIPILIRTKRSTFSRAIPCRTT